MAWALGKLGKWQEAETIINQALSLDSNCTFSLGLKGWYEAKKGNLKEAINYYQKAISLGDFPHWILLNQGLIYEKLNR